MRISSGEVHAVELGVTAPDTEQTQHEACASVQQEIERPRDPGKDDQRRGNPAAGGLGVGDGPSLRHQLAEHDVEERDGGDRDDGRDAAPRQEIQSRRKRGKPVVKEVCDGILGDVAEQDGRERDAELRRRQEPVQLAERLTHDPRLAIPAPDHRLDPRAAGRHQRELGRHEEGVGRDQREDGQEAQTEAVHGLIVLDLRRGHIRAAC